MCLSRAWILHTTVVIAFHNFLVLRMFLIIQLPGCHSSFRIFWNKVNQHPGGGGAALLKKVLYVESPPQGPTPCPF